MAAKGEEERIRRLIHNKRALKEMGRFVFRVQCLLLEEKVEPMSMQRARGVLRRKEYRECLYDRHLQKRCAWPPCQHAMKKRREDVQKNHLRKKQSRNAMEQITYNWLKVNGKLNEPEIDEDKMMFGNLSKDKGLGKLALREYREDRAANFQSYRGSSAQTGRPKCSKCGLIIPSDEKSEENGNGKEASTTTEMALEVVEMLQGKPSETTRSPFFDECTCGTPAPPPKQDAKEQDDDKHPTADWFHDDQCFAESVKYMSQLSDDPMYMRPAITKYVEYLLLGNGSAPKQSSTSRQNPENRTPKPPLSKKTPVVAPKSLLDERTMSLGHQMGVRLPGWNRNSPNVSKPAKHPSGSGMKLVQVDKKTWLMKDLAAAYLPSYCAIDSDVSEDVIKRRRSEESTVLCSRISFVLRSWISLETLHFLGIYEIPARRNDSSESKSSVMEETWQQAASEMENVKIVDLMFNRLWPAVTRAYDGLLGRPQGVKKKRRGAFWETMSADFRSLLYTFHGGAWLSEGMKLSDIPVWMKKQRHVRKTLSNMSRTVLSSQERDLLGLVLLKLLSDRYIRVPRPRSHNTLHPTTVVSALKPGTGSRGKRMVFCMQAGGSGDHGRSLWLGPTLGDFSTALHKASELENPVHIIDQCAVPLVEVFEVGVATVPFIIPEVSELSHSFLWDKYGLCLFQLDFIVDEVVNIGWEQDE